MFTRRAALAVGMLIVVGCAGGPAATPTSELPTLPPIATPDATAEPTPTEVPTPTPAPTPTEAPTAAPTPTEAPTAAPTALPPPTGAPSAVELFHDDMSDPNSGWGTAVLEPGTVSYADGALQLALSLNPGFIWSTRPVEGSWTALRVQGVLMAEPGTAGFFGLLCGSPGDDLVGVVVGTDGAYVFLSMQDNSPSILADDREAGLNVAAGQPIDLALDCVNSPSAGLRLQLYLDQQLVATHDDEPQPTGFDRVAVYAEASKVGGAGFITYLDGVTVHGSTDPTGLPPLTGGADPALLAHIPEPFRANCQQTPVSAFDAGAISAVACALTGEGAEIAEYVQFDSKEAMDAAYQRRVDSWGAQSTGDTCSVGPSELSYNIGGQDAGRLLCAPQTAGIRLDWTDDRLNILSYLADFDGDYAALFNSWLEAGPNP